MPNLAVYILAPVGLIVVVALGYGAWRLFGPWFSGKRPLG